MKINTTIKTLLVALMITSATQTQAMDFNWKKWTLIGAGIAGIALVTRYVINSMSTRATAAAEEAPQGLVQVVKEVYNPPLFTDIKENNLTAVQQYIADEGDCNLQNSYGWTALMKAATRGSKEIVQALIKAGADFNVQNNYGRTALMLAAIKGRIEIVQELLAAGADCDAKDCKGRTALMYAAYCGHVKTVEELIAAGADRDVRDCNGLTAADLATNNNKQGVADILRGHINAASPAAAGVAQ